MDKIKEPKMYSSRDVPESIAEEVEELTIKMSNLVGGYLLEKDPNIVLSAINLFHALLIVKYTGKNSRSQIAETYAAALIKNVECASKNKPIDKENETS